MDRMPLSAVNIHATAVLIDQAAVVIRGPSGAGKSTLALAVIQMAAGAGRFARLIGDDRLDVVPSHGRCVVRALPQAGGRIEIRGRGILTVAHEPAGVVRLVVDLIAEPVPRYPLASATLVELAGIPVPRLVLAGFAPVQPGLVLAALTGDFEPLD